MDHKLRNSWIGSVVRIPWPERSLGFTTCGSFLWVYVNDSVIFGLPETILMLTTKIYRAIASIAKETFQEI